ncbi:MAG: DUF5018 domain-containing protein [Salinivirgaceae bacterium]
MMKKLLLLIFAFVAFGAHSAFSQATDLFFSEYIEGSSNNKALEIFNGTGADMDLSIYSVKLAPNGGAWGNTIVLTGILANGDVYVIYNSSAVAGIKDVGDTASNVTYYNGDDALGLFKNDVLIDGIGVQGTDPGTAWDVAGVTTAMLDHTMIRKSTVLSGNTDWTVAAGTDSISSEWLVYAKDDFTKIGSHTYINWETEILTFTLAEQTGDAIINTADSTITIETAIGTSVTALIPTITVSAGATISPVSGVAHDFTNPVTYTVTAEDGTTTQDWVVTVTVAVAPSTEAKILTFSFVEEVSAAVIDTVNATVTSVVEWNADLTKLEPTITVSAGAQVTATVLPVDFTNAVIYRVTAQDTTVHKDWTVTVTKDAEPNHAAEITAFELTQLSTVAVINAEAATITGVLVAGTDVTGLTPTLTLSDGASYTPSGAQDFTNALVYTVTAQDGETTKDWTVTLTVLGIEMVSIHDIQYTLDASGDSPYKDQVVKTKGVVFAVDANGIFVQDGLGAWSGLYVYGTIVPVVGDSVLVEGQIQEYNNLTEMGTPIVSILNSGHATAEATSVTIADYKQEQYEGTLVKFTDVVCVAEVASKNWKVKQSTSTDTLMVRNQIFAYTPVLGEVYQTLIGIGSQYKTDYQLLPRSADDIIVTSISSEQLGLVTMYPNPVSNLLTFENTDGVTSITISNILGQNMNTHSVNNSTISIDMSKLSNGIYIVTLKSADGTMRSERIVKK